MSDSDNDRARPSLRVYNAVVERDLDSGLYVGYVPGWPGAHTQGASLDELHDRLQEVVAMLLEDGRVPRASEFVGVQTIRVA
jgi:predicted RNase H-like HicB family nuclease